MKDFTLVILEAILRVIIILVTEIVKKSSEAYEDATQAAKGLPSTHPIRLGLALNFSVFHYEIANAPDRACKLAKEVFHCDRIV